MSNFETDYQAKHIKSIKSKLLIGKEEYEKIHGLSSITAYQIQKRFKNENYDVSIPTITKILDPDSNVNTVNPTIITKLCKWWDIDLSYVFSLPEDNAMFNSNTHYGSHYEQLDDPYYHGDFTCYLLRTAYSSETYGNSAPGDTLRTNNQLVEASLSIKPINNQVIAKLIMHFHSTTIGGENYYYDSGEMTAIPVLNNVTGTVTMNFESSKGKQYFFMFSYQEFYNGPLYYREAVLLTTTSDTQALPLVQKVILLRNPVPEAYHEYILGLLSLNSSTTIVSEEKFDDMAAKYPEIQHFKENFAYFLPYYKRPFYIIPDALLDVNGRIPNMNTLEMRKALLLLKTESYSLAQIEFGTDKKAHVIAKDLQQYITSDEKQD